MRTDHIRALTGIRFFAALWVVCYHVNKYHRTFIENHFSGWLYDAVRPLVGNGLRGVDLFFMLSGYVLALNYLNSMGPRFSPRSAVRFIWLRLARIWPLFMLILVVGGSLIWIRGHLWDSAPLSVLTPSMFFQQMFLVQIWDQPSIGGSSWSGPAWSLSAEWLAYLLFPLLVLIVFRLRKSLPTWAMFVAVVVVAFPLYYTVAIAHHSFAGPYSWAIRIVFEFTAGMVLCAALSRVRPSERQRRLAGYAAIALVLAMVGWLEMTGHVLRPWKGILIIFAFLPLIGLLAIGRGPLNRFLATPTLVLGGEISYGVYLWHSPMLYAFRDFFTYSRFHLDTTARFYAELAWIPCIVAMAWFTFRFFEEPSREFMRGLLNRFPTLTAPVRPVTAPEETDPDRSAAGR